MWVAVTLKGYCNRTLQGSHPAPTRGRQGWPSLGGASTSRCPPVQLSTAGATPLGAS